MTPFSVLSRQALIPTILALALLVGCGDDDNTDGKKVAQVGDTVITAAEVERQVGFNLADRGLDPHYYDGPKFYECVEAKTTVTNVRKVCAAEALGVRNSAVQTLIQINWLKQEAKLEGIAVDDAEVAKGFETMRKSFEAPNTRRNIKHESYVSYLDRYGVKKEDLMLLIDSVNLHQQVAESIDVDEADARAFYQRNREQFERAGQRDAQILGVPKRARIMAAKRALDAGEPWPRVMKRFAVDSSATGRRTFFEGQGNDPVLTNAIFQGDPRVLTGPIKTRTGWYLYRVVQIQSSVAPFGDIKSDVMGQVRLERSNARLRAHFKDDTTCEEQYRVKAVPECLDSPA